MQDNSDCHHGRMPRAQTICCDMPRRNSSPSAIAPPTPLCMPHKTAQTATRAAARCVCVRDLLSFRLSIGDHSPISCQTDSRKNASAPIYSVLSSSVLVCWLSGWVISYHISSFFKFCKFRATLILPLFLPQKKDSCHDTFAASRQEPVSYLTI